MTILLAAKSARDEISDRLHNIKVMAWVFKTAAKNLKYDVEALTAIPNWETLAQDELVKAETVLHEALAAVIEARAIYARKSIIKEGEKHDAQSISQ